MVWCSNCAKNISRPDYAEGKTCCSLCGKVLDDDNFSQSSNGQRRTNSKSENEVLQSAKAGSTGMAVYPRVDATLEESESLSDIDDIEDDFYLHIDEETKYKTRIWEIINKEYLEEQAAKEAVELAAKKAYEAAFANRFTDELNRASNRITRFEN